MSLPSVSVILPNYNHAHYLPQCLRAILDQSVRAKEVIVIDDASTDNSIEIISEFAKQDSSIKLILNKKNLGNVSSTLKGLEQATGDYVLLASADDYLLPGIFELSLELLAKYPQAGLCSALSRRINEKGDYLNTVPEPPYLSRHACYLPPEDIVDIMLNRDNWCIMASTALMNREMALETKAFTTASGMFTDGFSAPLLALNYGACFIPKELGVYRLLPKSISADARISPKDHLKFVAPMWNLMETTYADKFPPEFRKGFKVRHLYQYGAMATKQLDNHLDEFAKDLKFAFENPSLIDRLFFYGNRILGKAQSLTARAYLFLRLRKFNKAILLRTFHRLKNLPKK